MRIARTFVWSDGRDDDRDEIRADVIARLVVHDKVPFELRSWDMRYSPEGQSRLTAAIYDEIRQKPT